MAEGEPIALALKRLRQLRERHRAWWKPYKPLGWWAPVWFVKPTQARRYKRFRRKYKARLGLVREMMAGKREGGRSWPPP